MELGSSKDRINIEDGHPGTCERFCTVLDNPNR